ETVAVSAVITWIPVPLLLENVLPVRLAAVTVEVKRDWKRNSVLPLAALFVEKLLPVTVNEDSGVLLVLSMKTLFRCEPVTAMFVKDTVPSKLAICIPSSAAPVPLFVTLTPFNVIPVTIEPRTPIVDPFWTFRFVRLTFDVLVSEIPAPVAFWIVPPVPAPPVPVTIRPPAAPVLLSKIPFTGPLATVPAEIFWNSSLFAPIVVFATFSAVPVVVVIVLTLAPVDAGLQGFSSQTSTVPPLVASGPGPVAVKAGFPPVDSARPPEKRIVAPVLMVREMPPPVLAVGPSLMAPVKLLVPPVVLATEMSWPASSVIVPP